MKWRKTIPGIILKRISVKICVAVVLTYALMALFADFIASDMPILLNYEGKTYWFANLSEPKELKDLDNITLMSLMVKDEDWGIFPPVPYGPLQSKVGGDIEALGAPSARHIMGTDDRGRDVLARVVHGARISLLIGFVAVFIYVVIGIFLGAVAGYYGGWLDNVISRVIETMMSFPTFFFILIIQGLLQRSSILQIMIVIGLTRWTDVARLVRAEVLKVKNENYILAAKAMGLSSGRVLLRHVLPNSIGPVMVAASLGIAGTVLIEAALSFLGFGTPPPSPSWGEMLTQAYENPHCWWLMVMPGAALFTTVLSYNLIGEALRDSVDPRLMYQ
ncbi:MAG: ABC transporter permease [Pseudomonadota bacterium]